MRLQARFPLHSSRFTLEHDTGGASEGSGVTVAEKKFRVQKFRMGETRRRRTCVVQTVLLRPRT